MLAIARMLTKVGIWCENIFTQKIRNTCSQWLDLDVDDLKVMDISCQRPSSGIVWSQGPRGTQFTNRCPVFWHDVATCPGKKIFLIRKKLWRLSKCLYIRIGIILSNDISVLNSYCILRQEKQRNTQGIHCLLLTCKHTCIVHNIIYHVMYSCDWKLRKRFKPNISYMLEIGLNCNYIPLIG